MNDVPETRDMAGDIVRIGRTKGGAAVVIHRGILYVGGVVADDVRQGMAEQTASIVGKIDALLAAHGSDKTRILSAAVFLTDLSAKPLMNKVWNAWLGEAHLPARYAIGITGNEEGALVEVALTAAQREGAA